MRFEDRFTERAKSVLTFAHEAAAELGHGYVGSEHILLGIARDGGGAAARVLRNNGLDKDFILTLIEKHTGRGDRGETTPQGLTPRAKRVIELAAMDANRLGHSYIGTEHLLLGILREPDSAAAKMMTATGLDLNRLYTDILNIVNSGNYREMAAVQA